MIRRTLARAITRLAGIHARPDIDLEDTMPRTPEQAIVWGRAQINATSTPLTTSRTWYRWCLVFVRSCFDVAPSAPTAGKAWEAARRKHRTSDPTQIPTGAPVFWDVPGEAEHVALSTGRGRCLSNDIRRSGRIDEVPIVEINQRWNATLLGWTEDINGVTVWTPPRTRKPTVNITRALTASGRGARKRALQRVVRHGSKAAAAAARRWLEALDEAEAARRELRKHEVR